MKRSLNERIEAAAARLRRFFRRPPRRSEEESPGDPYAWVGAPKKPRPPTRSRAAAEPLD